ncbi:MerR family transcriptional regulator, partial [Streptomyces sp. SID14478]|nr:MerR family transcriptional regulator [Streptomyces sp. SID14478]
PDDPRVAEAARALVACLPPDLPAVEGPDQQAFLDTFLADFSPAQAEVLRLALRLVAGGGAP